MAVSGVDEVVVASGFYVEAINFSGKAITVRSSTVIMTISGAGNFHVVQCVSGEGASTVLQGFTITGGNANGISPDNAGDGMIDDGAAPTVTNCIFSSNMANAFGGGMYNSGSSPTVTNRIFWGNSDDGGMDESAQFDTGSGTPVVTYSDIQGGWSGGGAGNINADPLFADAAGVDNTVGTPDDDLRLTAGSPCIDVGDSGAIPVGITTDLGGLLRFIATILRPTPESARRRSLTWALTSTPSSAA